MNYFHFGFLGYNYSSTNKIGEIKIVIIPRLKLNNWLIFQTTAVGMLMIASSFTGFGTKNNVVPLIQPERIEVKETLPKEDKKTQVERSITVEEYVRNYFSDIPIMVEIAWCESRFRQHDENGEVLRGEVNSLDRGVMQVNEFYHLEDSKKLGYDILTIEGNTAYARYIYEKSGVQPWISSSPCWSKSVAYSEYKELAMK